MNKTFKKEPFYSKFVTEENLANINCVKTRRKYFNYTFAISVFTMLPSLFATFIGFNFTHLFPLIIFVEMIISEAIAIFLLIKLYLLDSHYHVFKKALYFWLLYLGFFVIGICACICAGFNTNFIGNDDGSFKVVFNPAYFFFIFFPIYCAYIIFCYYAFMKCFVKYMR